MRMEVPSQTDLLKRNFEEYLESEKELTILYFFFGPFFPLPYPCLFLSLIYLDPIHTNAEAKSIT
jgi:hypothetical protein